MGDRFLLGALITHFLKEAPNPVKIWTDHKNLEYFIMVRKLK